MSAHGVRDFVFAAAKMTGCSFARSIILLAFLGMPLSASQQMPAERENLGNMHFPISCGPDAQRQFDRALAMLHSFWYPQALDAFTKLASTNPDCGMASWGIAVSARANPLVGPPDAEALKRGRLAVENAKAASVPTPRERDYIVAIEAYYHDWKNREHPARVLAYEAAMEQVYRRYPDDSEGALFYALAINEAVTVLPADKSYARPLKAGQIIERVLAAQPDHPGALHYLIHTYDFPPLAARGLSAAQRYAQVAPSAPHALHMPSHVFSMLGMWQESIRSNQASLGVAKTYVHAMDFMMYAYAITHFARAMGAARTGDAAGARKETQQLQSLRDTLQQSRDVYWAEQVEIQHLAAEAWTAYAGGEKSQALTQMQRAADLEDGSEKHVAMENRLWPMRELLGELLLALNRPAQALRAFELSSKTAPNRFRSLYGAARAAERMGDRAQARRYYERLVTLCSHADSDRAELTEARAFLARAR